MIGQRISAGKRERMAICDKCLHKDVCMVRKAYDLNSVLSCEDFLGWVQTRGSNHPPKDTAILVKFADGSIATAKYKIERIRVVDFDNFENVKYYDAKIWHLCGCFDSDNGRETHDGCCADPVEWLSGFYPEIDKNNSGLYVEHL